jgi:hypothetical protein
MARNREQSTCRNCGAEAYARDLCEPCYRFERRTGERRDPAAPSRLMDRRLAKLVRELEARNIRLLLSQSR